MKKFNSILRLNKTWCYNHNEIFPFPYFVRGKYNKVLRNWRPNHKQYIKHEIQN